MWGSVTSTYSSSDIFWSVIIVSDWLMYCCGTLIFHEKPPPAYVYSSKPAYKKIKIEMVYYGTWAHITEVDFTSFIYFSPQILQLNLTTVDKFNMPQNGKIY